MGLFTRIGENLTLMQAMFTQTGAFKPDDPAPIDTCMSTASSLRQASQRCMRCSETEACRKWLNIGFDEGLEDREPPAFCPNEGLQRRMRA